MRSSKGAGGSTHMYSARFTPYGSSSALSNEWNRGIARIIVSLEPVVGVREALDLPTIATAGWSIPKSSAAKFAEAGSGLARYASVFGGVEINSTFYRRHKPSTFARWAAAVPNAFRFSVKMPKVITHTLAMTDIGAPFDTFLKDIAPLAAKRGPLLCQLPPSLVFDRETMKAGFETMRCADPGPIVIEARHKSWASDEALALLRTYAISRVLADPAPVWPADNFDDPPAYIRLHGKPKVYYSSYTDADIRWFSKRLATDSWCVFDNTASGAAMENALTMLAIPGGSGGIAFDR